MRKIIYFLIAFVTCSCALSDFEKPSLVLFEIVDVAEKGIDGVVVSYVSEFENGEALTGKDGKVKLNLKQGGVYVFSFSKPDYTSQTQKLIILSGEEKKTKIILTTLLEDAKLNFAERQTTIPNNGLTFYATIKTNVNYEIESNSSWVKITKGQTVLQVECEANETDVERHAKIILHGDFNLKDTFNIKQLAGPVLRVSDYSGNKLSSAQNNIPFVTFTREISVVSAVANGVAATYELSSDRKTVYFKDIKLKLFSENPIDITVKASDDIVVNFKFKNQLFVNSQSQPLHQENTVFFTKNNDFCWVHISDMRGTNRVLKQYSVSEFKETNQISNKQFNSVTYNPFNNCLYLLNAVIFEDRYVTEVSLYDANTAVFKSKFTVDYNGQIIASIAFSENGFGLMQLDNRSLLYINSADNHKFGVYTDSRSIYDRPHPESILTRDIHTYNNFKRFVLFGFDSSGLDYIFTSVPESSVVSQIYSTKQYQNFYTSNSGTKAVFTYSDVNHLQVFDLESKNSKIVTLPSTGVYNVEFLTNSDGNQFIFTTKGWLISLNDYSIYTLSSNINYYYMTASDDGKYLLIHHNGSDYLFRSELITNLANHIN